MNELIPLSNGMLIDSNGITRPPWACANDLLREYYDTEWGREIYGEQAYFERLCLESFQAGLSWELILRRKEILRKVFADFAPDHLAVFQETDVQRVLKHPGMIRNERKIRAVISNAQACVNLRTDADYPGGLEELIRSCAPQDARNKTETDARITIYSHLDEVPTKSEESAALAKLLKKKGFSFVGPTSMYALLEAVGLIRYEIAPGDPAVNATRGQAEVAES